MRSEREDYPTVNVRGIIFHRRKQTVTTASLSRGSLSRARPAVSLLLLAFRVSPGARAFSSSPRSRFDLHLSSRFEPRVLLLLRRFSPAFVSPRIELKNSVDIKREPVGAIVRFVIVYRAPPGEEA